MTAKKTSLRVDLAEAIKNDDDVLALLEDALSTGDAGYIAHVFGVIARAKGMSKVAKKAGVTRDTLYKSLTKDGDPRLSTFIGAISAMNLRLRIGRAPRRKAA